jgi:hypothetical protein
MQRPPAVDCAGYRYRDCTKGRQRPVFRADANRLERQGMRARARSGKACNFPDLGAHIIA